MNKGPMNKITGDADEPTKPQPEEHQVPETIAVPTRLVATVYNILDSLTEVPPGQNVRTMRATGNALEVLLHEAGVIRGQ